MRADPTSYPVAKPYLPPQPVAPSPPTGSRLPVIKAVALLFVGVVSLMIGAFVLPGADGSAVAGAEPTPRECTRPTETPPESPPTTVALAPLADDVPKSLAVKPPAVTRSPHPLDAAPKVVPQLPIGREYELAVALDRDIDAALAAAKLPASPPADDAEFLRRVSLDLTGSVPTYERTVAFLLDDNPQKRAKLIDELLANPASGRHFAHIWADLLIKRDFDSNKNLPTEPFVGWLANRFNEGTGWDAIVRDVLTAAGQQEETPAALFYSANLDNNQPSPPKLVGATANLFLGIQLQCAECHVHPTVDKWGQKDFWGMAAFFGHLRAERDLPVQMIRPGAPAKYVEVERFGEPKGKAAKAAKKNGDKAIDPGPVIRIPDPTDDRKTTGTAKARFLEGATPPLRSVPYRPALADWLTSAKNPYFAPAAVNRLWSHLFARGLVHPVEEMHPENAPSHPAVLKKLGEAFVQSGYDLKFVLRVACNTRAYQRTSRPLPENAEDERLLSHMPVKVIGARELLDSLVTATGFSAQDGAAGRRGQAKAKAQQPAGLKRPAGPVPLVRFFDTREYDDDTTEFAYGVPQVLKLMNTGLTNRAAEAAGRVARLSGGDRSRVIEDLFLTALARRPRPEELDRMAAYVAKQGDPRQGYAGVMWALLNSAEFVSNH